MFLSKRPNGIYYLYYKNNKGKRYCVSTKSKLKREALKFLTNFQSELEERVSRKIIPITLSKFRFEFLKHSEAIHTSNTTTTFVTTFKYLQKFLGNIQLSEIKEKDIKAYIDYRITTISMYQARKDLINLSSCFNWAISEGYLLSNPCKNVPKVKPPQKLPLFFSSIEFEQLLKVINNEEFKALVIVAVNTGLREM
jgi:site-specific recombinase XerD